MDIQVTLNPETVEKEITAAIVNGAIGGKIAAAISEMLKPAHGGYRNGSPFQQAVEQVVGEAIRAEVKRQLEEKKAEIAAMVREKITTNALEMVISELTSRMWKGE